MVKATLCLGTCQSICEEYANKQFIYAHVVKLNKILKLEKEVFTSEGPFSRT
jgi:hypothetical protein